MVIPIILLMLMGCADDKSNLSLIERAQEIDRSLMCPVCPSETVDQSQVELAKQMRAIIREKLVAGESSQEIVDFFVSRYGESVLAAPTKTGFNLIAWSIPVLGLFGGIVIFVWALRVMGRDRKVYTSPGLEFINEDKHLGAYISIAKEEMAVFLEDPEIGLTDKSSLSDLESR